MEIPDQYRVLDATALGKRLGLKRDSVLSYLSRGRKGVPEPSVRLAIGPLWYVGDVEEWERGTSNN